MRTGANVPPEPTPERVSPLPAGTLVKGSPYHHAKDYQRTQDTEALALAAIGDAERKAWLSLAGYKFWMFGYHAAQWVLLKGILPGHRPNPFKVLVDMAKAVVAERGYKPGAGE
jgi:hypothetical protein